MAETARKRIVFWQNELSLHQSAHIKALAEHSACEVTLIAESEVYADRKALGWSNPDFGMANVQVRPADAVINQLAAERPDESVHIFTGIRAFPMVNYAFRQCLPTTALMGVFAESGDFRGWKGAARWAVGRRDALRYGKRINFLIPAGEQGVAWFRKCGFAPEKISPYGYWVEQPALPTRLPDTGPVHIVYVGQFTPRKGGDLLLQALAAIQEPTWTLTLVGSGPNQAAWQSLTEQLGISGQVTWLPVKKNGEALAVMASGDFLVLPSRFDGWGAVVNEALMCGVPVLCSTNCGARDLVEDSWRGEVFAAYSVPALRETLHRWILKGKRSPDLTARLRQWSQRITGEAAATYLLEVMQAAAGQGERPRPLWER